jgi:hypothetical protein
MPPQLPPAEAPARPPGILAEARLIVGQAARTLFTHPRETILPMIVIQAPVAVISAIVTTVLFLTAFKDEPFQTLADTFADGGDGRVVFMLVVAAAVQVLFELVARAATITAVAAVAAGRPKTLSEALDPAFSRMGGLIALAIIFGLVGAGLLLTVVGIILLPFIAARIGLMFETYILEDLPPLRAIARSWEVTRGSVIRFLTTIILTFVIILLPLTLAQLVVEIPSGGGRTSEVVLSGVLSVVQWLLLTPVVAFVTAVTTLFYLRLRERTNARAFA